MLGSADDGEHFLIISLKFWLHNRIGESEISTFTAVQERSNVNIEREFSHSWTTESRNRQKSASNSGEATVEWHVARVGQGVERGTEAESPEIHPTTGEASKLNDQTAN
jgi:hypothetical protein